MKDRELRKQNSIDRANVTVETLRMMNPFDLFNRWKSQNIGCADMNAMMIAMSQNNTTEYEKETFQNRIAHFGYRPVFKIQPVEFTQSRIKLKVTRSRENNLSGFREIVDELFSLIADVENISVSALRMHKSELHVTLNVLDEYSVIQPVRNIVSTLVHKTSEYGEIEKERKALKRDIERLNRRLDALDERQQKLTKTMLESVIDAVKGE